MEAFIISRYSEASGDEIASFVVIGTEADATAKTRELNASHNEDAGSFSWDGPLEFSIAVKP